jgi:hypothetical protein
MRNIAGTGAWGMAQSDEKQRDRIEALRELAPSAHRRTARRSDRGKWRLVALAAAGDTTHADSRRVGPRSAHHQALLPQTLAWSPDGNRVAVQLSDNTCSQQGAHLLAIFDARQGKLLRRFDLDLTLTKRGVTDV